LEIKNHGNTVIIDDSFNSNPVGAKAALDVLELLGKDSNAVKILITPGMVALGAKAQELNKNFGIQAAAVCDYVILAGEHSEAGFIQEGLEETQFPHKKTIICDSFNNAITVANERIQAAKKIILIENDLPDNY
jgi:UDP-N-acetylmuramoyl-tripeptide--D-alanyl-D-alanine ligase